MTLEIHKNLVIEIDTFIADTGMGVSYFGKAAVGNSEVVSRLKRGKTIHATTEHRLREFMCERRKLMELAVAS